MSTFHQLWSNKDKKQLGVHLFGLIHVPIIFAKQHHFWLKAPFPWPHLNLHAEIHIILVKISLLLVDNCFTGKIPIVWFDSQSFLLESRCANCLTTSFSGWITIFARQIDMFLVYPMSSPHDSWQKPFHSNISIISISRHGAAMVRPSHRGGLVWPCMVFTGLPLRRSTSRRVESSRPQATCAGVDDILMIAQCGYHDLPWFTY